MKKLIPYRHLFSEEKQLTLDRVDGVGGRYYVLPSGKKLPSVTTVLGWKQKDSLIAWRKRVGEEEATRISSSASRRGTKLHKMCEDWLLNKEVDMDTDLMSIDLFNSIVPILDEDIGPDILAIEQPLYSEHLGLAGTVDCIARYKGKRSIIDFKTSSKLKKEEWIDNYFQQCACYAVMYEEMTGIPIAQLVVIIAVEYEDPQIFIKKRDDWIESAKKIIKEYYNFHQLT